MKTSVIVSASLLLNNTESFTPALICDRQKAQGSRLQVAWNSEVDNDCNEPGRRAFVSSLMPSILGVALTQALSSQLVLAEDDSESKSVATFALRTSALPTLTTYPFKLTSLYEGQVIAPEGWKRRGLKVSFTFPSDWLQLDAWNGGIQYVDQRNGDKLYVLRATLPAGTTMATVPKKFFGDAIFDPQGSIQTSSNLVDEFRVSKSSMQECADDTCPTRRRLLLKYFTVTGNGLRTERRGLVDAYEVGSDVYMLMTSSNANKFEKNGRERETVESIVDSFRVFA